jgi:glycerol-3-phosphate acyltransferase PlsY
MVAGFIIGGLAMVFGHGGPIWWLFWVGSGVAVLGLLLSLATNMFEDWY